jgi:hypothetical protein
MQMKKTSMQLVYELLKSGLPPEQVVNYLLIDEELMLEKEKEQIEDAHIEGQRVFDDYPHTQWTNDQAEAYYKNTYKKQ